MITLTEVAANKLKELFEQEKVPESSQHLRIRVVGGGCSGFQYELKFDEIQPYDQVFEDKDSGIKIICDPKSCLYLTGSEVDYVEGLTGARFVVKNPNVKGSCGCGQSFDA